MERRKTQRSKLIDKFRVYDHRAKTYLGVIADASIGGFMIKGESPIRENDFYRLGILLPEQIDDANAIDLSAICKWSVAKDQGTKTLAGFQIVEIDEQQDMLWRKIIEDYAFSVHELDS